MRTFVTGAARLEGPNTFTGAQIQTVTDISAAIGSDLVTNGTFAADTNWTKGTGWTIAAGVASCDGSQVATTDLTQTVAASLVEGDQYQLIYTITVTAGNITAYLGSTEGNGFGASNTYTEELVAGATETLTFTGDADFTGTLDNVTLKNITIHWDARANPVAELTLAYNTYLIIDNLDAGGFYTLIIHQDGVGSRTLTVPGLLTPSGAFSITAGASATDILQFLSPDGALIYGYTIASDIQ